MLLTVICIIHLKTLYIAVLYCAVQLGFHSVNVLYNGSISLILGFFSNVELFLILHIGFSPGLCRASTDLNQLFLCDSSLAPAFIQL